MISLKWLATCALVLASAVNAQAANIVETAKSAGQFNTLIAAAKAAGLAGTLSKGGPFTVFAPTDAAFEKLPKGTVATLLMPKNKRKLARLLKYHVIAGRVPARAIKVGRSHVVTLAGKPVTIRKHGSVRVNASKVIKADVKASNGVIHVIDKVLMP